MATRPVDPQLDVEYRPKNPECHSGAVDLSGTGWPGTKESQPWRGALRPSGLEHHPMLDRGLGRWAGFGRGRLSEVR